MVNCLGCKVKLPPSSSRKRKYCDKCIKERQIRAGRERKGIPFLPSSYRPCAACGTRFTAKVDSERTLCKSCLKERQRAVHMANTVRLLGAIQRREDDGMWYTCECGHAVTWQNTVLDKEHLVMVGIEKCGSCGLETEIAVPVTQFCAICQEPLFARKGTKIKHCTQCAKELKRQEIIAYLAGVVLDYPTVDKLLSQRHTLIKKLQEWDKLL